MARIIPKLDKLWDKLKDPEMTKEKAMKLINLRALQLKTKRRKQNKYHLMR